MIFKKNKKGGDKLISVYWFAILTLIAGGIVMMTNSYYSSPYDVRESEANIFAAKLANCVYPSGKLNPEMISAQGVLKPEFVDNFESHCGLNIMPKSEFEKSQYYGKMTFYKTEKKKDKGLEIEVGNSNFLVDCKMKEKNKNMATCVENEFWVLYPGDQLRFVTILTAVGKVDQNA